VGRYQKGKTNLDFTEARDSEWQWQQPGHMQVCTSLQADNYASTPPLSFLQTGCPSCKRHQILRMQVMSYVLNAYCANAVINVKLPTEALYSTIANKSHHIFSTLN